jgi:hypothetical protein
VSDNEPKLSLAEEIRTPRAAAVAGIIFAVVMATAFVLFRLASPLPGDAGVWIADHGRRTQVSIAIFLVPYAGIAFLWFIGVIRARLGVYEDRLFATAFLGSGLLFVAMLFAGAAVMGGLITVYNEKFSISVDSLRLCTALSGALLTTFGIRMAAVFTIVVTNLGRRAKLVPKWLVVFGYISGVALLFAPMGERWAILLFPIWVFTLSVHIFFASANREPVIPAVDGLES